jgi:acetyl-CoA carboxylase biotin carboxyl carrier protein
VALSDDDVREILRLIDESELDELLLETDRFKLHVLRGGASATAAPDARVASDPPATPPPDRAPAADPAPADGTHAIEAPMLGTFYRAEGPGKPPFVDVGSEVQPDTIVCIIEVMKMMNSVAAGVAGTVVEVCHENAELVEYGAPLFRVESA